MSSGSQESLQNKGVSSLVDCSSYRYYPTGDATCPHTIKSKQFELISRQFRFEGSCGLADMIRRVFYMSYPKKEWKGNNVHE